MGCLRAMAMLHPAACSIAWKSISQLKWSWVSMTTQLRCQAAALFGHVAHAYSAAYCSQLGCFTFCLWMLTAFDEGCIEGC